MFRRIVSLFVILMLVLGMFVGCAKQEEPAAQNSETEEPAEVENAVKEEKPAETEEPAENVKLTFSGWGDANEKATVEKILAQFTEDTGIEVEYLYIPENYATKLTTMASSNELPDVGYLTEQDCIRWANQGMLLDMGNINNVEGFDEKLDGSTFVDANGNICGYSMACQTYSVYYNKAYFDEMGVEYPPCDSENAWSWDEFVDVCRKLTVDVNGKHPNEEGFDPDNIKTYALRFAINQPVLEVFIHSNGGSFFSEDGLE